MKENNTRQSRFYERYQVEDVLTFISRQLVQAKNVDGNQVFIQEVRTRKPLPPGSRQMLVNLNHPHVAPVLDVQVEENRVTFIHPPFAGDPLPVLVNEKNPMNPAEAVRLFYKLLKTMEELAALPLPLTTTLDPKNICVSDEPYLLFFWFKKHGAEKPPEEKWRGLLFFLLTGVYPKEDIGELHFPDEESIPPLVRDLAMECLDSGKSRLEILGKVKRLLNNKQVLHHHNKKRVIQSYLTRAGMVAGILLALVLGSVLGYQIAFQKNPLEAIQQPVANMAGLFKGSTEDRSRMNTVRFDSSRKKWVLPEKLQTQAHIRGEFRLREGAAFTTHLKGEGSHYHYGLTITDRGQISVTQGQKESQQTLVQSEISLDPDKTYLFDILYIPNDPLHIRVQEKGSQRRWLATGPVPLDSIFQVEFEGREGTALVGPRIDPIQDAGKEHEEWMAATSWHLIDGAGVMSPKRFDLDPDSKVEIMNTTHRFSFRSLVKDEGDPLQLNLESRDGVHFRLIWKADGRLRLYRMEARQELLKEEWIPWKWQPNETTHVHVTSTPGGNSLIIRQGDQQMAMEISREESAPIRKAVLVGEQQLRLVEE